MGSDQVHVYMYSLMMVGGEGAGKGLFSSIFHFIFSRPYARRTHYVLLLRRDMLLEIVVHRLNDV